MDLFLHGKNHVIEKALSVDNVFVFALISTYFAVLGLRSLHLCLSGITNTETHYMNQSV
ncbi:hypothetical protein ACN27E_19115 [Mycobacterium sp. WMMD1722]|uniref:hypothetical protein n=1 Tax=Mycobacterium sp. WMMD1722 TaxID=3404117 RepID=UPI003BF49E92